MLAGPYCTMILGDLGADVIKVEAPGGSDDTRAWGPPYAGEESAYYLCANRNKRSITLNLKTETGRQIARRLINNADVVIENFKAGTMERLGLGYKSLSEDHPKLIFCSITGFGQTGPYKDLPGYDFIIQAMSGLMSITGTSQSGPVKVGVAISDIVAGLYSTIAILAALQEREHSGKGQRIDISLFDSQLSSLINVASNYLISGIVPGLLGNKHPNIVPYQVFQTLDSPIVIAAGNDSQFKKLCKAIDAIYLAEDPKYIINSERVKNRDQLISSLQSIIQNLPSKQLIEKLNQVGVPCGPIQSMNEVFSDPHILERNMLMEYEHPSAGAVKLVGSPIKLSRTNPTMNRTPPMLGEHTNEVLMEIGFSNDEINSLKESNVI